MPRPLKRVACGIFAAVAAMAAGTALANPAMPVAQQNALVEKYCAVCHTDAAGSGGLSLEHFDAGQAAPSLAAMMVSKLTSGVSLETTQAASSDPNAAALVSKKMQSGAIGASGIPRPEKATIDALIDALASEAAGANQWKVERTPDPATRAPVVTASVLRETPSAGHAGEASSYRLVLKCNPATGEGEMQLALAPAPKAGAYSAAVDGQKPVAYEVEATAAINLYESKGEAQGRGLPLPAKALRFDNLVPNESVEFSFGDLPRAARQSLAACFEKSKAGQ